MCLAEAVRIVPPQSNLRIVHDQRLVLRDEVSQLPSFLRGQAPIVVSVAKDIEALDFRLRKFPKFVELPVEQRLGEPKEIVESDAKDITDATDQRNIGLPNRTIARESVQCFAVDPNTYVLEPP